MEQLNRLRAYSTYCDNERLCVANPSDKEEDKVNESININARTVQTTNTDIEEGGDIIAEANNSLEIRAAITSTTNGYLPPFHTTTLPYGDYITTRNIDANLISEFYNTESEELRKEIKEVRKRISNLTSIMLEFLGEERMKKIIQEKCTEDDNNTNE